jgi:hypothetical protein
MRHVDLYILQGAHGAVDNRATHRVSVSVGKIPWCNLPICLVIET